MAKKIDRARIEAGRAELPKKLAFLVSEKVDFNSVTDKEGQWSVEISAGALHKLVKARGELKALKADNKKLAAQQASAADAERAAHEETRDALAKAERRIKALEKKLAAQNEAAVPAADAVKPARRKAEKPSLKSKGAAAEAPTPPVAPAAPAPQPTAKTARVPKKVSAKKATVALEPLAEVLKSTRVSPAA